jgi:hypothetical protein
MSTNTELLNYLLIDQRLRQETQPSLENLIEFLREELQETEKVTVTPLFIKGCLKRMRKLYHAPIAFNFSKNVYYYKIPSYNIFKLPAGVLNDLITTLKLNLILGESYSSLENIKFEHARTYAHAHTGSKHVPLIAKAISEKKIISLVYKSAGSKRSREYNVIPFMLEQILGKWALTGKVNSDIRMFLLEEIQGLPEITTKKAEIPNIKEIEKMPLTKKIRE